MALRSIVVDDEFNCRSNLKLMLKEYCPDIEVVGEAESAEQARGLVNELNPNIVFLDIMMPNEDGFGFLHSIEDRNFSVVFTTAYNEYALKAIKESAVDYIEKPINIDDLQLAVDKLKARHETDRVDTHQKSLQGLIDEAVNIKDFDKTCIPTRDGFAIVKSSEIIHLVACEGYTKIYLTEGRRYMSCNGIRKYEEYLNPKLFFRVHKSHIINMAFHLVEFIRTEGNIAVLSNGKQIPISRRNLTEFLNRVQTF